jgi:hypothetical protein
MSANVRLRGPHRAGRLHRGRQQQLQAVSVILTKAESVNAQGGRSFAFPNAETARGTDIAAP